MRLNNIHPRFLIMTGLLVAFTATLGSFYFSDVLRLAVCDLCWYQRIAMYPLFITFVIMFFKEEWHLAKYMWPLVGFGFSVASWQWLTENIQALKEYVPCRVGLVCGEVVWQAGPVTISLLSFIAFLLIGICLFFIDPNFEEPEA